MIVDISVWLSSNWKLLTVLGTVTLGGGKATHSYVTTVDGRLDTVEQSITDLSRQGAVTQCMIIQHDIGNPPLVCLDAVGP